MRTVILRGGPRGGDEAEVPDEATVGYEFEWPRVVASSAEPGHEALSIRPSPRYRLVSDNEAEYLRIGRPSYY